jgi:hypothetical protein
MFSGVRQRLPRFFVASTSMLAAPWPSRRGRPQPHSGHHRRELAQEDP